MTTEASHMVFQKECSSSTNPRGRTRWSISALKNSLGEIDESRSTDKFHLLNPRNLKARPFNLCRLCGLVFRPRLFSIRSYILFEKSESGTLHRSYTSIVNTLNVVPESFESGTQTRPSSCTATLYCFKTIQRDRTAYFRSLICTGARWKPVACGTNQKTDFSHSEACWSAAFKQLDL